jgi:hypothetical protein
VAPEPSNGDSTPQPATALAQFVAAKSSPTVTSDPGDELTSLVDADSASLESATLPVATIAAFDLTAEPVSPSLLLKAGNLALDAVVDAGLKQMTNAGGAFFSKLHVVAATGWRAEEGLHNLLNAVGIAPPVQSAPMVAGPSVPLFSARRIFHFARLGNPAILLSDSIAAFTEDSASLPASAQKSRWRRAFLTTGLVLAADVALFVYLQKRPRSRRTQPPFFG